VGTPPPRELLALSICHRNRIRRVDQAVPDLFEELQAIGDAERLDFLAYRAHGRILRFSLRDRNRHASTDNATLTGRGERTSRRSGRT
jgi:hypothetical protein